MHANTSYISEENPLATLPVRQIQRCGLGGHDAKGMQIHPSSLVNMVHLLDKPHDRND